MPAHPALRVLVLASTLLACAEPETPEACGRLTLETAAGRERVEVLEVEQRSFRFERAGYELEGTLRLPQVDGDYRPPAVIIVHGSGAQGRRGLVTASLGTSYDAPIPIYESLAEQLAAAGFAVLTYDKRSCFVENRPDECTAAIADYPGDLDDLRIEDFLEDARAGALALATMPELSGEVVVIGHSQGASFVPRLSREQDEVVAGLLLGGATLSLVDTIAGQLEDYADALAAQDPGDPAVAELRQQAAETRSALEQIAAGSYPEASFLGAPVAFWSSWIALQDQLPADLAASPDPLAAYFGGADLNVGPAHAEALDSWIDAGDVNVELVRFPGHTHGFVRELADGSGYGAEVSAEVVETFADWINALD